MTLTPAEKKAAERTRKRAAGLSPLEVWLPRELHDRVRKYVQRLLKEATVNPLK